MRYIIDRFEGSFAVCEDESRQMRDIEKSKLPKGAKEGDCLLENNGVYVLDSARTDQRRKRIQEKMEKLWE